MCIVSKGSAALRSLRCCMLAGLQLWNLPSKCPAELFYVTWRTLHHRQVHTVEWQLIKTAAVTDETCYDVQRAVCTAIGTMVAALPGPSQDIDPQRHQRTARKGGWYFFVKQFFVYCFIWCVGSGDAQRCVWVCGSATFGAEWLRRQKYEKLSGNRSWGMYTSSDLCGDM